MCFKSGIKLPITIINLSRTTSNNCNKEVRNKIKVQMTIASHVIYQLYQETQVNVLMLTS